MDLESALRARFAAEADAMENRPLDLDFITARGNRMRNGTRVLAAAALLVGLAVTSFAVSSLTGSDPKGETFAGPASVAGSAALSAEAEEAVHSFLRETVADTGGSTSWEMLTQDARDRVGSLREWNRERQDVYGFLGWALGHDVDFVLTQLPPSTGDRYVATLVAEPNDGSALLQPLPLVKTPDGFLVDLASPSFVRSVSLEPLNPRFMAAAVSPDCSPGDDCAVELPEWPLVKDGDLFGVAIEPAEKIADVWFAIGSEWVAAAELSSSGERVIAEATFEAEGVTPGEQVFLVAIRTDGAFETYGYRVTVED